MSQCYQSTCHYREIIYITFIIYKKTAHIARDYLSAQQNSVKSSGIPNSMLLQILVENQRRQWLRDQRELGMGAD